MSRPLVIAHRGASGECPENTFPAFARAIELQADMIETDLHLTRDEAIVIHHDAPLSRLGVAGEIADRTSAELAGVNAAPGADTPESIPRLAELLEAFGDRIDWNLELKVGTRGAYPGLEARAVAEVEARDLGRRVLYSSFDDGVLSRLRGCAPTARLAVLVSPRAPAGALERAEQVGAEAINPHVSLVDQRFVRAAHDAGLAVYPYTANARREMHRMLDCGVDGVITNHVDRLHDVLATR